MYVPAGSDVDGVTAQVTDPHTDASYHVLMTGVPAEVTVTSMSGGASCEMFRVERLGQSWVVRRAPLTSVSDTAHQVVREARVIESLAGSGVPVPTVLAIGEDPEILCAALRDHIAAEGSLQQFELL